MSDAFLHGDCYGCEWMTQSGGHDAISISCVNPKIKRLAVKRTHIVLVYSSLLAVRNCDITRFGDIVFAGQRVSKNVPTLPGAIPPCLRRAAG
jgi:hypothetical protein